MSVAPTPWSIDRWGSVLDAQGRKILIDGVALPTGNHPRIREAEAHARLLRAAPELLCALYDIRRRRIDDGMAADDLAAAFDLPRADVRRVVGLPEAEEDPS